MPSKILHIIAPRVTTHALLTYSSNATLLFSRPWFPASPSFGVNSKKKEEEDLRGLSSRVNYTDRATAACQRS
jgi:hypothetical protein